MRQIYQISYDILSLSFILSLSLSLSLSLFAFCWCRSGNAKENKIFIYYCNQWISINCDRTCSIGLSFNWEYSHSVVADLRDCKATLQSLRFALKSIHDKLLRYSGLRQSWGQNTDIGVSRPVSAFFSSAGKVCSELFMRVVSQRCDYGFSVGGLALKSVQ